MTEASGKVDLSIKLLLTMFIKKIKIFLEFTTQYLPSTNMI